MQPAATKRLAALERLLGPTSPELAPALKDLAELDRRPGRLRPRPCRCWQRAVTIEETNYGAADAAVAVSLNNLALLQGDRGAWRDADALLARAAAIEETALGRDSPELIATLENRAAVLDRLDRREEAAAARQRAAAIRVASAAQGTRSVEPARATP